MKYLNALSSRHHHGEDAVEWSPHVCTQPSKGDDDGDGSTGNGWSFLKCSAGVGTNSVVVGVPEVPTISYQSYAVQRTPGSSAPGSSVHEVPVSPMTTDDDGDEATDTHGVAPRHRDVLGTRDLNLSSCCFMESDAGMEDFPERQVSLEPRKPTPFDLRAVSSTTLNEHFSLSVGLIESGPPFASFVSTSSSGTSTSSIATTFSAANEEERTTPSRLKRPRGGSDFSMTMAPDRGDFSAAAVSSSPLDRCKRRRLNRNRALAAQEFDSILSQINITGSF
jgi:hypothetical protein